MAGKMWHGVAYLYVTAVAFFLSLALHSVCSPWGEAIYIKGGSSLSGNHLWKHPHKHAQRHVSEVTTDTSQVDDEY